MTGIIKFRNESHFSDMNTEKFEKVGTAAFETIK